MKHMISNLRLNGIGPRRASVANRWGGFTAAFLVCISAAGSTLPFHAPRLIAPPSSTIKGIAAPVTLSWKAVPGADAYRIAYRPLTALNRTDSKLPLVVLPEQVNTSVTITEPLQAGRS